MHAPAPFSHLHPAIGCGQWQLAQGSNAWTCYVTEPSLCFQGIALTVEPQLPGDAFRACPSPAPNATASSSGQPLPSVAALLARAPQLSAFRDALSVTNLTGLPADQITGTACGWEWGQAVLYRSVFLHQLKIEHLPSHTSPAVPPSSVLQHSPLPTPHSRQHC